MDAKEMDIHSLDRACVDMDIAIGYIRKFCCKFFDLLKVRKMTILIKTCSKSAK